MFARSSLNLLANILVARTGVGPVSHVFQTRAVTTLATLPSPLILTQLEANRKPLANGIERLPGSVANINTKGNQELLAKLNLKKILPKHQNFRFENHQQSDDKHKYSTHKMRYSAVFCAYSCHF